MAKLTSFAGTQVSLFKTQDDVERLLTKHGIAASRWTHFAELPDKPGVIRFEFEWKPPQRASLGFRVEVNYQYQPGKRGGNIGTTREQAGRALFWHVKNLFDAVEFGIVEMEQAFMPYLLTSQGTTFYEEVKPKLDMLQSGDLPLLITEGASK